MRLKENSSQRKLSGSYYTPIDLAERIVEILKIKPNATVLEPSCGDGAFLKALDNSKVLDTVAQIDAVEIEASECEKVKETFHKDNKIRVFNEDFFSFCADESNHSKYDYLLANPPFIRYQYLSNKQREIQASILTSHGMKSNRLINMWVAFLIASADLLKSDGSLAFIIPAEFMQVAYSEELRLYLLKNFAEITLPCGKSL